MNINIDCDAYIEENGEISAAIFDVHGEIINESKHTLYGLFQSLHEQYIIPSSQPHINSIDMKRLIDVVNILQNNIEKCKALLQSTNIKQAANGTKTVNVFRYIRRPEHAFHSNYGGITFLFSFVNTNKDRTNDKLRFSYSICAQDENFNTKAGTLIASDRMQNGEFTEVDYDRNLPLIDNVIIYLSKKDQNNNLTQIEKKLYQNIITNCM